MVLSVVRPRTVRAWALTAAVALVAVLVPQVPSWLPVSAATVDPAELRHRVLDSASQPYQGYAYTIVDAADLAGPGEVNGPDWVDEPAD